MTPSADFARERLPVAVLISGRGSNMLAIARRALDADAAYRVCAVVSDQPQAPGLASAASLGLPTAVLPAQGYPNRAAYDAALAQRVLEHGPKLIVLAGFMRILTAEFVQAFAGRLLNVHPSLLPRYRGLHTHRRALEAGDAEHGASVHFVTAELDGGPVVVQAVVDVRKHDTEATLSARVQEQEHKIYPLAVDWFARGRLELRDGCVWLDGRPRTQPVLFDARTIGVR